MGGLGGLGRGRGRGRGIGRVGGDGGRGGRCCSKPNKGSSGSGLYLDNCQFGRKFPMLLFVKLIGYPKLPIHASVVYGEELDVPLGGS